MEAFGVRRTKVGVDAKSFAYVVSTKAVVGFSVVALVILGVSIYYTWALEAKIQQMELENGWRVSEDLDEEGKLANYFFHSAEILFNIIQSEQQSVHDGVLVSESILQELGTLQEDIEKAEAFDQLLAHLEKFGATATNIANSFADSNQLLSDRAKLLSKSLATTLSSDGDLKDLESLDEWQQITTWNQVSRCFAFISDAPSLVLPSQVQDTLLQELEALEAGTYPTASYLRPNDIRKEMQQLLLTSDEVRGIRPNVINQLATVDAVQEVLREIMQVVIVQENMEQLKELKVRWEVDNEDDETVLEELHELQDQGILPLFWIAGHDIMGVHLRKFMWWQRPSPFDLKKKTSS